MKDNLTSEFYETIDNTVKYIKNEWILIKNGIDTGNLKDMLNQIYTISIEPNIDQFSYKLSKFKTLYRAVKSSDIYPDYAEYKDMIPQKGSLNRWNPEDKIYLYLSGAPNKKSKIIDKEYKLNICEKTCMEEIRAVPCNNTKITMCSFKVVPKYANGIVINMSFMNQSYDDILNEARNELKNYTSIIIKSSLKKVKRKNMNLLDIQKYTMNILQSNKVEDKLRKIASIYVTKGILKIFLDEILIPLDDDNDDREKEYKPFHDMAEFFESKKFCGIYYQSTRMKKIKLVGSNVVLFNKDSAVPQKTAIRCFIY
ncbi:hypothetical protein SAMN02745134_00333 [Clostridium acidisoli DSM 12555]|uniref:Uncharacterized protein n=1 Tax=Clostridium acidisoli DSM 12555 TaxID=1121291 RepID=A0A1W1X0L7_9CLOT|nr:hypothetical protein [Clostridium acidisoli]SMC17455.1 hypothetical protein SAMN02745134_00333 [Clostridium acidisoli DSM 12555]